MGKETTKIMLKMFGYISLCISSMLFAVYITNAIQILSYTCTTGQSRYFISLKIHLDNCVSYVYLQDRTGTSASK